MNGKKIVKRGGVGLAALLLINVGSIVWFEARLGINQPQGATSLVIATFNDDGERHERVVRLETIDGISYVPLLRGQEAQQAKHDHVYFELHWPTKRGVRQGDWVALQENTTALDPNSNPVELYNLKDDLAQENNLADQYPEKLEAMKALLAAAHSPNEHFAFGKKKNKK